MVLGSYWVYVARTGRGTLYTGIASDIAKRIKMHSSGKGAKFMRAFRFARLEALWIIDGGRGKALSVEYIIKKLTREEKDNLIKRPASINKLITGKGKGEIKAAVCTKELKEINSHYCD